MDSPCKSSLLIIPCQRQSTVHMSLQKRQIWSAIYVTIYVCLVGRGTAQIAAFLRREHLNIYTRNKKKYYTEVSPEWRKNKIIRGRRYSPSPDFWDGRTVVRREKAIYTLLIAGNRAREEASISYARNNKQETCVWFSIIPTTCWAGWHFVDTATALCPFKQTVRTAIPRLV